MTKAHMKIALVTYNVHRHRGVPLYVANLATALVQDHEVTIFSSGFEGLGDTGVRHRRVWAFGGGLIWPVTFNLSSSLLLFRSRLKKEGGFDIIHVHAYDSTTPTADLITSHFCEAEDLERLRRQRSGVTLGERLERQVKALLEKALLWQSRGKPLIVLSERMKREFLSHYALPDEMLFVIPSGVDSTRFSPANVPLYRNEIRSRHRVAAADTLVLFVGGYWERKGVSQAIRALPRLCSSQVTLLVVGNDDAGRYRELARREGVEKRVIFAGPQEETWKYYAAADIFLLPTLYEAFGLSVLEAMATGLPVVVSNEAGVADLINDGINGLLLDDPKDVTEISAKLALLLGDVELRRRMGTEARTTALQYTWSHVAQRTVQVYRRILATQDPATNGDSRSRNVGGGRNGL